MTRKPLQDILVKPAGPDCNMNCAYCFYTQKKGLFPDKAHRMSLDLLEELMRQLLGQPWEAASIGWQGGEPTLMGLTFFREAVELEKRYGQGKTVANGLQTNGTLIDRDWVRFLKEYRFLVGLSLDGPAHVHDRYRSMHSGEASWPKVKDCAGRLLDAGVPVNALSVVNDYSVRFPDEIYDFYKHLGITHMQFIPCVEADPADPGRAAPFSVPGRDYGRFLCRLFDRWRGNFVDGSPTTSIRFFESVLMSYAELRPPECTLGETCGPYLVIEHNGDVYSCDFFVEPAWRIGNIKRDLLVELLNSPRQREFSRMKAALPARCAACRWINRCHGGCTKDRLRDPRDNGANHFCAAFEMFFAHADGRMRHMVKRWRGEEERLRKGAQSGRPGRNQPCSCGSGLKYKKCCGRAV